MLRKNLTIRCEDDSLQFDIERQPQVQTTKHQRTSISPFSKTSKKFEFFNSLTSCQTPKTNDYPRQSFEFKSPKYAGIIEKNVLERLKLYEQRNKDRKHGEDVSTRAKIQEAYIRELRDKPQINDISKNLFEKVKKEKRLSPNILQRFQTYQCQRVSRNAKYQLCRASGLEVKNTTSSCRNNIKNHLSKSKSPLKQRTQNRSKSKSPIKHQNKDKHSQNIGKIITRPQKTYKCENSENIVPQMAKPKQQFLNHHSKNTQKILIKCNTDHECDSPWSFTPNQTNKQFKKSVKNQQLSPISQKKSFTKSKKWTVLI